MNSVEYYKNMLPEGQFESFKKFDTINDLLVDSVKKYADKIAIKWNDGEVSYAQLEKDVAKARVTLITKGIKKGDVVGIMFNNEYDFVKSFLAVSTLGAIVACMPLSLPTQAIFGLSFKFTLKAIVYNSSIEEKINEALKMNAKFVSINVKELDNENEAPANKEVKKEDGCAIVFTGGTTGSPKGALLSHDNLTRGALNGCYCEGNQIGLKYVSMIPFTHVFGIVRNLLSVLMTGSTLYIVKEPSMFVKESMAFKPDIMVLVPALANLVYGIVKTYGLGAIGGNLKYIICGGAAVPPTLITNLLGLGIKVTPGYGLTETANLVSGSKEYATKPASVGVLYPHQEVKVVEGELRIKGDNVFMGYFNDPEATKAAFDEEGYFKTGDLVKFDEEGFLYIVGRSKNVIVFNTGNKVSPEVLEAQINKNPLVNDTMVYLDKNEQGNEILTVQIYPSQPAIKQLNLTEEEVKAKLEGVVALVNKDNQEFERIKKVIIRKEDFVRSPAMKILRDKN